MENHLLYELVALLLYRRYYVPLLVDYEEYTNPRYMHQN